jgi:hypothetical protein
MFLEEFDDGLGMGIGFVGFLEGHSWIVDWFGVGGSPGQKTREIEAPAASTGSLWCCRRRCGSLSACTTSPEEEVGKIETASTGRRRRCRRRSGHCCRRGRWPHPHKGQQVPAVHPGLGEGLGGRGQHLAVFRHHHLVAATTTAAAAAATVSVLQIQQGLAEIQYFLDRQGIWNRHALRSSRGRIMEGDGNVAHSSSTGNELIIVFALRCVALCCVALRCVALRCVSVFCFCFLFLLLLSVSASAFEPRLRLFSRWPSFFSLFVVGSNEIIIIIMNVTTERKRRFLNYFRILENYLL